LGWLSIRQIFLTNLPFKSEDDIIKNTETSAVAVIKPNMKCAENRWFSIQHDLPVPFMHLDTGEISKVDEYEMRPAAHIALIHLAHRQTLPVSLPFMRALH
jgi:hypothetical protein